MLTFNHLILRWNQFFFRERPTYNLALFRIFWGGLIFFYFLLEAGNVADFYGPHSIVSWNFVNNHLDHFYLSLFKILNHNMATAVGIYVFTLINLFLVTIGYYTRAALFGALIGIVSLHMRNVWITNSADVLVRCIFVILIWSPCYNVLSIDSYIARKRGRPYPVCAPQWTWRLIQIQLSVVYLWTFWAKIKGDTWFDGSAVYYATRLDTMKNFSLPWILDNKIMIKLSTWGTLIIECALGSLVWFKRFRTPVVISGILLHLGIEVVMAIPFFEWMMIFLLMNYYTPGEYAIFYQRSVSRFKDLLTTIKLRYRFLRVFGSDNV